MVQNFPGLVGVRPDSGDVIQVTADTTEWLMDAFGYETNSKGFKVLPPFVRTVQGDGVNRHSLPEVFIEMERRGMSCENAVFGMGGGLLQHCNRDTDGVRHEDQRCVCQRASGATSANRRLPTR